MEKEDPLKKASHAVVMKGLCFHNPSLLLQQILKAAKSGYFSPLPLFFIFFSLLCSFLSFLCSLFLLPHSSLSFLFYFLAPSLSIFSSFHLLALSFSCTSHSLFFSFAISISLLSCYLSFLSSFSSLTLSFLSALCMLSPWADTHLLFSSQIIIYFFCVLYRINK